LHANGKRLSSWWKTPLWAFQLATGAKSFVDNPILGSPRLNQRGLHSARVRLAHRLARWRRQGLTKNLPSADRLAFDRDGYVCVPDFLPPDEFEHLQHFLLNFDGPAREHRQGDTVTRRVPIDDQLIQRCPALGRLLRSKRWRALMNYVASTGGEPLYYLQTIVTGHDGPPDPQLELHADAFHPSMKAWLFLTNVQEDEAPLTYVAGSHRLTPARLAWEKRKSETVTSNGDRLSQRGSFRVTLEELTEMGLPAPTKFAVRANTLVVADTFGFHARGPADRPTVRVEIWAYRRRSPFLPWTGLNLLSLPGVALKRAQWGYRIMDWLGERGIRQQHWTPVNGKRALDR
jgi:hypothetical protein